MTEGFQLEKEKRGGPNFLFKNAEEVLKKVLFTDFQRGPVCEPSLYFEDTNYLGVPAGCL